MSEKASKVGRGKSRREVITPLIMPEIDTDGVINFNVWRNRYYKQPILDKLTGYYRFNPTKAGAEAYTRPDPLSLPKGVSAVGKEAVKALIEIKREAMASRERQQLHTVASAELATALFWTVAYMRKVFLEEALAKVSENKQPEWDVASYAADAVLDFGLCLESPYEHHPRFAYRKGKPLPQGMKTKLDEITPDLGPHLADFGKYASVNKEALRSHDGVVVMEAALEEQDYRINFWKPRHQAVVSAFPQVPISEEILNQNFTLREMLAIESDLYKAQ